MNTNQLLKQAAASLEKVRDENRKLAEEKAAMTSELEVLRRREECLKLAREVVERDGITDYKDLLKKAQELDETGQSLDVLSTAVRFAGARDFTLGKVAEGHRNTTGGGTPEDEFIAFLMSEE